MTRPRIEHYETQLRLAKNRADRVYYAAMLNLLVTAARKESVTLPAIKLDTAG